LRRDQGILGLFMAHRGALVDYASGIVGSRAQGEDVVQEAWLRFDGVAGKRFLDEPLGYLYRIVRNMALDGRRQRVGEGRYLVEDGENETRAEDRPSPEAEVLHRQQLALVREALAELPERTRLALEMHRLEGHKLREIAAHFGISVALAHALVADGVEHCRRRLERRRRNS
jgi:RNA polymerase sigma factor (sigma-70 family)